MKEAELSLYWLAPSSNSKYLPPAFSALSIPWHLQRLLLARLDTTWCILPGTGDYNSYPDGNLYCPLSIVNLEPIGSQLVASQNGVPMELGDDRVDLDGRAATVEKSITSFVEVSVDEIQVSSEGGLSSQARAEIVTLS